MIKVHLENEKEVVDALLRSSRTVREEIEKAAKNEISDLLRGAVHSESPVRTGLLRDSIQPKVHISPGGSISVSLKPPQHEFSYQQVEYKDYSQRGNGATIVHVQGHKVRPHVRVMRYRIRKKTVRKLEKRNPAAWYLHLVELGTQRGVEPNPFRDRAIQKSLEKIKIIYQTVIQRCLR